MQSTLIMSTGDRDPFTYGGGLVFEHDGYHVWVTWEYLHGEVRVYQILVPYDVLDWYDWVDAGSLVTEDLQLEDITEMSGGTIRDRIEILELICGVYGLSAMDEDFQDMSCLMLRGMYEDIYDRFLAETKGRSATEEAMADLKVAEDTLRDHMPELHDDDLAFDHKAVREALRYHRDACQRRVARLGRALG